ncbi:MAG: glycosyltransferase family 1 protein [Prevotella sp.]|nr:glycosyltransferase family 1 protein [Candidatus Prevotella equi]
MKILLVGEYSGVHYMLAEGLRELGHEVTVASNGDFWKDYPRDIDLQRNGGVKGILSFFYRLCKALPKMRGYDIVQLVNPMFLELKAERLFEIYDYLRKHNKRIVLAVVGDDYYYPYINKTLMPMRYSDYNIGNESRCTEYAKAAYNDWVGTEKERLNKHIAKDCDAIIAGTYEYWLPYHLTEDKDKSGVPLREKLYAVPFPFKPADKVTSTASGKLRVFIGISKQRSEFKGTDIMLKAAQDLQKKYPERMELKIANGIPYAEYQHMMDNSDVVMDQLYSHGPGMNGLLALSKGLVTFTGGEPEHYDLMAEKECRPIVNVQPSYESVYNELEQLLLHPENIENIKRQSREYVLRNYDYMKVAKQYEEIYKK